MSESPETAAARALEPLVSALRRWGIRLSSQAAQEAGAELDALLMRGGESCARPEAVQRAVTRLIMLKRRPNLSGLLRVAGTLERQLPPEAVEAAAFALGALQPESSIDQEEQLRWTERVCGRHFRVSQGLFRLPGARAALLDALYGLFRPVAEPAAALAMVLEQPPRFAIALAALLACCELQLPQLEGWRFFAPRSASAGSTHDELTVSTIWALRDAVTIAAGPLVEAAKEAVRGESDTLLDAALRAVGARTTKEPENPKEPDQSTAPSLRKQLAANILAERRKEDAALSARLAEISKDVSERPAKPRQ